MSMLLNKDMLNFVHNDDPFNGTSGGKRTLSSVLPLLQCHGMDSAQLWEELKTLCTNVCVSMCEVLRGEEKVEGLELPEGPLARIEEKAAALEGVQVDGSGRAMLRGNRATRPQHADQ